MGQEALSHCQAPEQSFLTQSDESASMDLWGSASCPSETWVQAMLQHCVSLCNMQVSCAVHLLRTNQLRKGNNVGKRMQGLKNRKLKQDKKPGSGPDDFGSPQINKLEALGSLD